MQAWEVFADFWATKLAFVVRMTVVAVDGNLVVASGSCTVVASAGIKVRIHCCISSSFEVVVRKYSEVVCITAR